MRAWLVALAAGCSGSGISDDTSNPTDPSDTDSVPTPAVETACDDTVDDDGDGAVDCNDSDCFSQVHCSWPTALSFETQVQYDPSFAAELAGYSDCTIVATSTLQRDRAQSAPGADRVFCGALTYPTDTCPEEFDRPLNGCYAFAFGNDASWPIWYINPETSGWELLGNGTLDAQGWMRFSTISPVVVEGTDAGDVTSTFGFRE